MSIFLLNPFFFGAVTTFPRTYYDAGFVTTPTAINTTQATHRTISTTETAGDEFAFFWQALLDHEGTAADAIAILNESPTERQRFNLESQDATDQHSVGGAYAYAGGSNRTITLDSIEESAATNEIQDYSLCALKLSASDEFGHSAGQTDSVSSTYATKTSVTVGAGTWLIIASASVLQSAAGVSKVRVFDGTTTYGEQSGTFYAQDTTNWIPYWFVRRLTTTNTTTFSLQNARVATAGTASIRQATIIALDTSKFENVYYAEQFTDQTTTSTTAWGGTGLSSTFNFAKPEGKHLLISCAWTNINATNRSTNARLFNTTTSTDYTGTHVREGNATTERYATVVGRVVTFANASETIEWEHYVTGGTGTATIGQMAIAILDLGSVLTSEFRLWSWGEGNSGVLGDNTTTNKSSPVQTAAAGTDWSQLGSYKLRSIGAVKTDGSLWMWGSNVTYGQLGDNTTTNRSSPVQTVSTGTNWQSIAAGYNHSAAIKTDGTLWSWGEEAVGALGNNSNTIKRSSPVQTVSGGSDWSKVACGQFHTSAIKTDGTLWSWGANTYGQLGNNETGGGSNVTNSRSSPVQVLGGGTNWSKVACAPFHVAAIKTDGTLWLWGLNQSGQLGDNSIVDRVSPVQTVSATTNWSSVACGDETTVAIKTDGSLWLWGLNSQGQLGDNSRTNRSSPVQTVSTGTNWQSASAGFLHTAAVKTDGSLWLWGSNNSGQLGNNNAAITAVSSPIQTISGGNDWISVSCSFSSTFAIKESFIYS